MQQLKYFQIDPRESEVIKQCLNYAYHRITKHDHKYLKQQLKNINKLRKQFGENIT